MPERVVQEGAAEVSAQPLRDGQVFYNKAQVVNRDVSVLALRWLAHKFDAESAESTALKPRRKAAQNARRKSERTQLLSRLSGDSRVQGLRVLEGLAATGLRAVRYALEQSNVGLVVAADSDENAASSIASNAERNDVSDLVYPVHADMCELARDFDGLFDVVDIDPYGTPAHLLDSAVQAVSEGGMLCVTATDTSVLCGTSPETCFAKYGCMPFRSRYQHEQAVRILLSHINSHAARYRKVVMPVLCAYVDFYVRVFVRLYTSPSSTKLSASVNSHLYQCAGCDTFKLHQPYPPHSRDGNRSVSGNMPSFGPHCPDCSWRLVCGGPIWNGMLHDRDAAKWMLNELDADANRTLDSSGKVYGLLTNCIEEESDIPLYFHMHTIAHTVKGTPPNMQLARSAMLNAGYSASVAHANPLALKTDAPSSVVWDLLRAWNKEHPMYPQEGTPGYKILNQPQEVEISWSKAPGSIPKSQHDKVKRFPYNPESHWGPLARAGKSKPKQKKKETDQNEEGGQKGEGGMKRDRGTLAMDIVDGSRKAQRNGDR